MENLLVATMTGIGKRNSTVKLFQGAARAVLFRFPLSAVRVRATFWEIKMMDNFGDDTDSGKIINDGDFRLTDEMNSEIVFYLRMRNHDQVSMYAAKLIEFYQMEGK